jgi:hypothetical protein
MWGAGPPARGSGRQRALVVAAIAAVALKAAAAHTPEGPAVRGLSHGPALARAYDAILDAEFDQVAPLMADACDDVPEWCAVMEAVSLWWQIALEPESERFDARFSRAAENAIAVTEAWTEREPRRAEAWFARGAAYGARAQWRVERHERLAAARDGKHIRNSLERALALDPTMHDAKFGIGMYRYYADVAPAALRMLRWLLLLPGGDREAGLEQMIEARDEGTVIRGEADYQLHLIYLWYEERPHDALALIRRLQQRYPHNPHFALIEARIHEVYFHDAETSAIVLRALIARAQAAEINAAAVALRRARAALTTLDAPSAR